MGHFRVSKSAVALAAARVGAEVLAVDFSPGMVRRVLSHGLTGLNARQREGQALALPDASFDAVILVFGVMLFPDWCAAGLSEMARVTRSGGSAAIAVWKDPVGAATNLLLSQVGKALYPELVPPAPIAGLVELSHPHRLAAAMIAAGFVESTVEEVTRDFRLDLAALDDANQLFGLIPRWSMLETSQRRVLMLNASLPIDRHHRTRLPLNSSSMMGNG